MATDSTKSPLSDAEKKARTILAKALWNIDNDQDFADAAARNAAFKEVRKDYLGKARKLSRYMDKRGMSISVDAA